MAGVDIRKRGKLIGCGAMVILILICVWIAEAYNQRRGARLLDDGIKMMQAGDPVSLQNAVQDFTEAASIFMVDEKERVNYGTCEYDLGLVYQKLGDDSRALSSFAEAIPLLQGRIHQQDAIQTCREKIGSIRLNRANAESKAGNFLAAITDYHEAAVALHDAGDDQNGMIAAIDCAAMEYFQGLAYFKSQNWQQAIVLFRAAQFGYQMGGKRSDEAHSLHYLALAYKASGDKFNAAMTHQQEQSLRGAE